MPAAFAKGDPRHDFLSAWHSQEAKAIDSLTQADLYSIDDQNCLESPTGMKSLLLDDMSPEVREDLLVAMIGLLKAYRDGSPEPVLAYMNSRGEVLDPSKIAGHQKHYERINARSGEPEEIWSFYWVDWKYGAQWEGVVLESSCISLSQCSSAQQTRAIGNLARHENQMWQNAVTIPHLFKPADNHDVEQEIDEKKAVLLADVRLVIKHSDKLFEQRSPYFIRFWLNSGAQRWHPLLIKRSEIDLSRTDGVKILF